MAKISVIMGIYNCQETLEESVESILRQSYHDWELIMCDDCSKDGTYSLAKKYEKKYPGKIKVIRNEKNLTLGPTLNRCLELASGDYIARQDGDDKSVEDRLKKQIEFLEKTPQYILVASNMFSFDSQGIKGERGCSEKDPDKNSLVTGTPFCHATIMARKEMYQELKGYRTEKYIQKREDLDLWFRFFQKGYRGYNLQEALYMVRDDGSEYKRRSIASYLNEFRVRLEGYIKVGISPEKYIFLLKPMITPLLPLNFIKYYHKIKLK